MSYLYSICSYLQKLKRLIYFDSITVYILAIILILLVILLLWLLLKSPFVYPYFIHIFDVSNKRNPHIEDYLDNYLISGGLTKIQKHKSDIEQWKSKCEHKIEKSLLKNYRRKQYERILDDDEAFHFYFSRTQTRYVQRNYVKSAYKVPVQTHCFTFNYNYILDRHQKLADIGFECPLRDYHSKNQRKLVTPALRKKIMERDNYTCQICGKYMPDEVGLQIDHIIPVSKGGKSVSSNLRVLCSKCNGAKSDKMSD